MKCTSMKVTVLINKQIEHAYQIKIKNSWKIETANVLFYVLSNKKKQKCGENPSKSYKIKKNFPIPFLLRNKWSILQNS